MVGEVLFEVVSKFGRRIRVTRSYWNYIVNVKHPFMNGLEETVKKILEEPLEVRRSHRDPNVYLYYGAYRDKLICIVVKHLNKEGFIITAYPTRRKICGEVVWRKQLE